MNNAIQNKVGAVNRIARKEFLADRKKARKSGSTWCVKDGDNTLFVYVSVHGYGRRILASYCYVFGGVTDACYGNYTEAAQKDAHSFYYTQRMELNAT